MKNVNEKRVKYIVGIIFLLIISEITNGQKNFKPITTIDIEGSMKKMEIINLSQYARTIRYKPLETKNDLTISNISDCIFSGNNILIRSLRDCWLFNINGNLVKKIGTQGRGPGEYQYVVNARFDNSNKIYIQSLRDILEYKQDGSFITKYINLFMFNSNMNDYFSEWQFYNDSLIFGHIPNNRGSSSYKALLIDKTGNVIFKYKNYDQFKISEDELRRSLDTEAHIYQFNRILYYKSLTNDTLFYLDKQYNLVPDFIFNLGRYKEPMKERTIKFKEETTNLYLLISKVFQTKDYLIFNCDFGDHFPAKRLTPKKLKLPNGNEIITWTNTRMVLGMYDKRTRKISFSKPSNTDNLLYTSGIYNDIDGGPRFFPQVQVNDSTMAMWIDPKQLKDHVASSDFKKNIPKYPEKKKELELLTNSLSVFDNPVLMFVTFK
jgi:hypothetical protein